MKKTQGFSLIEVLVTIVLTTVGILGMVALQGKSIQYTQDAVNRNTAVTLANELIEVMRAHRDDLFENKPSDGDPLYTKLKSSSAIYNGSGVLQLAVSDCPKTGLANSLKEQGGCWLKQVHDTLPDASALQAGSFKVCPSYGVDSDTKLPVCGGSSYQGSSLMVQLAWRSKEEVCGEDSDSDICTYVTRVEL